MSGFAGDIESLTVKNRNFRSVIYTARNMQLVLMSLAPGEDIGMESHPVDQFFRVEEGFGEAVVDGHRTAIGPGSALLVPAGSRHDVTNTGRKPLKLYTLYAPPNHRDGTVHGTKADAMADDERYDGGTTEAAEANPTGLAIEGVRPWVGRAWRVDYPLMAGGKTAYDVVMYEEEELGNDNHVPRAILGHLKARPASDVVWVCKRKADCRKYVSEGDGGDVEEYSLPLGSMVIGDDGEGGYLVLKGGLKGGAMRGNPRKSYADRLAEIIEADEYLELFDIDEEAAEADVYTLLESNIAFVIKRELGAGSRPSVVVHEWEMLGKDESRTTDTILGTYSVSFRDDSEYGGNFAADGIATERGFVLNAVYPGSHKLKYFG